jgi:hypothetical protein
MATPNAAATALTMKNFLMAILLVGQETPHTGIWFANDASAAAVIATSKPFAA